MARDEMRHKTALAFQFTSKWNDPAMFHVRDAVRALLLAEHDSPEFNEHLRANQTNVIHFLNFLEEVAIAMEKGGADSIILREAFRGISLTAWSKLHPWVADQRRRRNAPQIWVYVEELAKKWNH